MWFGDGALPAAARAALAPASLLYGAVVRLRGAAYDRGLLGRHATDIPAVSVGNLTVGGTGKTPVAAWIAGELLARGASPAIVLRGYGDDEPLVHAVLNPGIPVIVGADRVDAVSRAAAAGAGIAVLDDAFQHRRARRAEDVVLVSADAWEGAGRLLPAGPWREPLSGLRRATLAIVTRKAASLRDAEAVGRALRAVAPGVPVVIVRLAPDALRAEGDERPVGWLQGRRVHAIAAIGDPAAFVAQLAHAGAEVRSSLWPDHHRFTRAEAASLAGTARDDEALVCTLKDAVKLRPLWPRAAPPLWYLSQRVLPERGADEVHRMLDRLLLRARAHRHPLADSSHASHGYRPQIADE